MGSFTHPVVCPRRVQEGPAGRERKSGQEGEAAKNDLELVRGDSRGTAGRRGVRARQSPRAAYLPLW